MNQPENSCRCEPCPIDLSMLFPGARIFYEDNAFQNTRCKWHWLIRFDKAQRMTVAPSGIAPDGTPMLWVDRMPRRGLPKLGCGVLMESAEQGQTSLTCQVPVSAAKAIDQVFHARRR